MKTDAMSGIEALVLMKQGFKVRCIDWPENTGMIATYLASMSRFGTTILGPTRFRQELTSNSEKLLSDIFNSQWEVIFSE
jgi:hypothetical protein